MKSDESGGVAEGEFMERVDDREEGHGKHKDFGIKERAEEFLELGERGENEELIVIH